MATISKAKLNKPVDQSFISTTKTKDQTQRESEIAGLAQGAIASADRTTSSVQKAPSSSKNSNTKTNFLSHINIPTIIDPNKHKWGKFYNCIGWCFFFLGMLLGIGAPFAFLALTFLISGWFFIGAVITAPVAGLLSLCLREFNNDNYHSSRSIPVRESPIYSQNSRGSYANKMVRMLAEFITKPLNELSEYMHFETNLRHFCEFFKIDEQTKKTLKSFFERSYDLGHQLHDYKSENPYISREFHEEYVKYWRAKFRDGLNIEWEPSKVAAEIIKKWNEPLEKMKRLEEIKRLEEKLKELDREFEAFRSTPHKNLSKT